MSKIVNSCSVIGIAIAYLLILGGLSLSENEALFLIRFAGEIIRIVLSVVTFFIIYTKLNKEFTSPLKVEDYYMAAMPLVLGVILLIGIKHYILKPHKIDDLSFDLYKQALEWLQVGMLITMMKWYRQDKNIKEAVCGIFLGMVGVSFLSIYNVPMIEQCVWGIGARCFMRVITIMMILIVGYLCCREKYLTNLFMQRMFFYSLLFKVIINGVGIVRIFTGSILLALMQCILQIVFMIWVILCINEYTYRSSWAKMEFEIEDKKKERKKMQYSEELLATAVEKIEEHIEGMVISLEELEECWNKKENQLSYIDKIRENCLKLYRLSSQIIKSDTQAASEAMPIFENTNLYEYVQSLIEVMEPYIRGKGMLLEFCVTQYVIMAQVNQESIERILFNLISNAVKYNKKGGSIRVTLSQRKEWVYLCVQDSGIGIPESELATIFDKYARVKNKLTQKQEGSGLGLNNVKYLVEKHDGEIKIVSQEGKGTLVCIKIPTVHRLKIRNKEKLAKILAG